MHYRNLGRSGARISAVGLGCNRIGRTVDLAGTRELVQRALEEGVNFFDTADVYGNKPGDSEELLGEALAGQWNRVLLATKVRSKVGEGPNDQGASRYHIQNGVESCLRRLRTDHIDLLYIHSWDSFTPVEEMMRALDDLVQSGKVRYLGASNFAAWQLGHANDRAERMGKELFVVIQPHYHMLRREIEQELIPYCRYAGIGIVPYFPLAGGLLTGKYGRNQPLSPTRARYIEPYLTQETLGLIDRLSAFAQESGHTLGELAIAWLLGEPQVSSVIAGATMPDQISANARATEWKLSPEEMAHVRTILEGKPG